MWKASYVFPTHRSIAQNGLATHLPVPSHCEHVDHRCWSHLRSLPTCGPNQRHGDSPLEARGNDTLAVSGIVQSSRRFKNEYGSRFNEFQRGEKSACVPCQKCDRFTFLCKKCRATGCLSHLLSLDKQIIICHMSQNMCVCVSTPASKGTNLAILTTSACKLCADKTAGGTGGADETGANKDTHQSPVIQLETSNCVPASFPIV